MTTRRAKRSGAKAERDPAEILGHVFQAPELLARALTHRSSLSDTSPEALGDPTADNEQLEFLGDAILGMVAAAALYHAFPRSREGELTRLRASVVSRKHLGGVAARIGLGPMLRLGRGEEISGGREKPAILADALEALIAALYLDGGLEVARTFVARHVLEPAMPALRAALDPENTFSGAVGDHKSALQELLQAAGKGQPRYVLAGQTGPDHRKRFVVEVWLGLEGESAEPIGEGEGGTKKEAQQEAAKGALARLGRLPAEPA